ncbi:MAG: FAD:protein FMN transferase [Pirellulales bacterium]
MWRATDGAYDPTSGPSSCALGFTRCAGRMPTDGEIAAVLEHVGMRHVELNADDRTIRFLKPGVALNLGSIGKGYALDRAGEILRAHAITDGLLHGGNSSVLALGSHPEAFDGVGGWWIGVRDPWRPDVRLGEVRVRDRAAGTSGAAVQYFIHGGKRYGHILDPRTGRPAEGILSTTVLAPTAAEADALSTAFYVMGVEAAAAYLEARPEVTALLFAPGAAPGTWGLTLLNMPDGDWRTSSA